MKKMSVPPIGGCVALALLFTGSVAAAEIVPTPRATALPATATNRPFLSAAMTQEPVNLAARGYTEEEYLVSGSASVYDWATVADATVADATVAGATDSALQVRRPQLPYTTRLLLRRPLDAKRFSGRVIVELLDDAAQGEAAPLWGLSQEHFLRQGDVWVGLTLRPGAVATLQRFDPLRYAKLQFAPRAAGDCGVAVDAAQGEAGLAWDIVAQLGALLRSSSKENPLAAYTLRRVIAAGYAQSGADLVTYINALHARLRLGDGRPVYDGYLIAAPAAASAPLSACAVALPGDDPRRRIGPRDVPVVAVLTQTDVEMAAALRRSDGDEPGDIYRGYEIAGAAQVCNEAPGNFPAGLALNAIWMQFDDLLARGLPMQHAPPLQFDAAGRLAVDAQGNALGGLRLPQIAVPVAVYTGRNTPKSAAAEARQLCSAAGAMRRLDSAELKALYGSRAEYLRRYNAAVDQAVIDRWLVPADAAAMKSLAARTPLSF